MSSLYDNSKNEEITDLLSIKTIITFHYQNFWNQTNHSRNCHYHEFLIDIPPIQLKDDSSDHLHLITQEEIEFAIKSLTKHTSPGSDGLTPLFYSLFEKMFSPLSLQLFNNIYIRGDTPESLKNAIVKLILKSGSRTRVENWRPISFLNCDYKILDKIISMRLLPVVSSYISSSQQCGLPKRHLSDILLNVLSAIEYETDTKHPLALLQLDFSKAFDPLSHKFIFTAMEHIQVGLTCSSH